MSIGVLLSIIFMVLKLTGVIGWTWFYVLLPLIIELIVDVIIIVGAFIFLAVIASQGNSR